MGKSDFMNQATIQALKQKEIDLLGSASPFFNRWRRINIWKGANDHTGATLLEQNANSPEKAIHYYNDTGEIAPLIAIFERNDLDEITALLNEWDDYLNYKRAITESALLSHIYKYLSVKSLCWKVHLFTSQWEVQGHKRALLELLLSQQNPLTSDERSRMATSIAGIKDLQHSEIESLAKLLTAPDFIQQEHEWVIRILAQAQNPSPATVLPIFDRYIETHGTNLEQDEIREILLYYAKFGGDQYLPLIQRTLEESVRLGEIEHKGLYHKYYSTEDFMLGYARLAKQDAIPYLQSLLDLYRDETFKTIGVAAEETKDKMVVKWLLEKFQEEKKYANTNDKHDFTWIIEGISPGKGLKLTRHLYESEKELTAVKKFLRNIKKTDDELIKKLRSLKLISKDYSNEVLKEGMENEHFYTPEDKVLYFLKKAKRYFYYDSEAGTLPPDYEVIIKSFEQYSQGTLDIEFIRQSVNPQGQVTSVVFDTYFRRTSFMPEDNEDWYDIDMISAAVNFTLLEKGREAYFMEIETRGQEAAHLFATPAQLQGLVKAFNIEHRGW